MMNVNKTALANPILCLNKYNVLFANKPVDRNSKRILVKSIFFAHENIIHEATVSITQRITMCFLKNNSDAIRTEIGFKAWLDVLLFSKLISN